MATPQVAADDGRLLSAEATDTEAGATSATAAAVSRSGQVLGASSGGRLRAGAVASALVLGVVASAMVAVVTLRRDAAKSEEKEPHPGDAAQLWGSVGGSCATQGCQCDCGWAASPNACSPQANDGHCCWSCCCGGGVAVVPGVRPDYDQMQMGRGDAYHGSYGGHPDHGSFGGQSDYYGQAPDYYRGQERVVYYHRHHYVGGGGGGGFAYVWWVVLLVVLSLLACAGVYLYLRPPAK